MKKILHLLTLSILISWPSNSKAKHQTPIKRTKHVVQAAPTTKKLESNKKLTSLLKKNHPKSHKNLLQAAFDEIHVVAHNFIFPDDNFFPVQDDQLYRSKQLSTERLIYYIDKFGIKTVINLRSIDSSSTWWQEETDTCRKKNVNHYDIPMSPKMMTPKKQLLELLYLYDNAPRPILVHCRSGADRTGEASAIWVLEKMERTNTEAARQLAVDFGHSPARYPAKDFLISIWQGRAWLANEYDPANYPHFAQSKQAKSHSTQSTQLFAH